MGPGNPFWHLNATFDAVATVRRHEEPDRRAVPGYLTNVFGVRIEPAFFPPLLDPLAGQVEEDCLPNNWHADLAEFAAALRAVECARERFTMIELGCGWGCWMNITGVAARRLGLDVHLIGVEGDEGHVAFGHRSMAENGFDAATYEIQRGVAAATDGVALFPRQDVPGAGWGSEPVFGASDAERERAIAAGTHDAVEMIALPRVAAGHDRIDLLHVDIQGGEADLIAGTLPFLREKVAYLLVGTHSRPIEGRLYELLQGAGFKLEVDRPLIQNMDFDPPITAVDGVQGWRNPDLLDR